MSLLENLAQGFAGAAGATDAAQSIQRNKDDRRATAHEELEAKSKMIWDDVKRLQDRRASLDPKSPTYAKEVSDIDASLKAHQGAFTDLYHPEKNPGALRHLGRFLRSHLTGQKAPVPTSPGEAKQSMAQLQASAAGPGQTPSNPIEEKIKQLEAVGVPHDKAVQLATGQKEPAGKYSLVQGTVGDQPVTLQHGADGTWKTLNGDDVDESVINAFRPIGKAAPGSTSKFNEMAAVYEKQWGKKLSEWTPEELTYFNQKMAYDAQHSGQSTTTRLEKDDKGVIHPVEITSTRGPIAPPVDPHGKNIPKTPGEAKKSAKPTAPKAPAAPKSSVREEAPLSFKGATPDVTKAKNDYNAAVKLDSLAKQAKESHDPVQQRQLALALIKGMAGRVNMQEFDQYTKKMGVENTVEGLINGISTGEMPSGIVDQLVRAAGANLIASKASLDVAEGNTGSDAEDEQFLLNVRKKQ